MKDIKERIKEFSELIKQYPYIKDLYLERAKLYEKSKQYKKALDDYKKMFTEYYICKDIATVCEENNLKKEAEEFYTKAINKDKSDVNNYINRLYFYVRIEETEKALADCNTILKLSPKNETILTLKKILTGKVN